MLVVQRTGKEAVLPQVAGAAVEAIYVLRIDLVDALEGEVQGVLAVRRGDQMKMIGHQAIALDLEAKARRRIPQKVQEYPPVIVHEENILTIVSPLGHVVRTPGQHDSC
jgi:hypothetical protein